MFVNRPALRIVVFDPCALRRFAYHAPAFVQVNAHDFAPFIVYHSPESVLDAESPEIAFEVIHVVESADRVSAYGRLIGLDKAVCTQSLRLYRFPCPEQFDRGTV